MRAMVALLAQVYPITRGVAPADRAERRLIMARRRSAEHSLFEIEEAA